MGQAKTVVMEDWAEFFKWLEVEGKLDWYEAALDISQDYAGDQSIRLKASDDIDRFIDEFKKTK
jgi:hypothetical protein